jgi:hypothetical protein
VFKADGNYELGELLPSVLSRMKDYLWKSGRLGSILGQCSR